MLVYSWKAFLEKLKVKGLKKAVKKQDMFKQVDLDFQKEGLNLKQFIRKAGQKFGLKSELRAYKSGSFGITFLSGDKTLKLTTSVSEAKTVSEIINNQKKKKLDHIVHYEDIYQFQVSKFDDDDLEDEEDTKTYYVILMEKVIPLESPECPKEILKFFEEFLYENFEFIKTEEELLRAANGVLENVKNRGKEEFNNYVYDMVEIIRNYMTLGISNNDLHAGNFGINDSGNLVSFDPMGDYSGEIKKVKKLKI